MTRPETTVRSVDAEPDPTAFTVADLLRYFVRLGTFGFGGPIALCGYMQRDLVERIPEPLVIVAAGIVGLLVRVLAGSA